MSKENEIRPPNHRSNTIKAALHIIENSQSDTLTKINATLIALYPEDLKAIETNITQTLKTLENKV